MTKYRIVKFGENLFEVQFRSWFVWYKQNTHGSVDSAKRCIDYLRKEQLPSVLRY